MYVNFQRLPIFIKLLQTNSQAFHSSGKMSLYEDVGDSLEDCVAHVEDITVLKVHPFTYAISAEFWLLLKLFVSTFSNSGK